MIINGVIFQRFNNSSAEHTIIHKTLQSIIQNDNASDPIKHTSSNIWIDNAKSRLQDPTSRSRLGRFGKRLGPKGLEDTTASNTHHSTQTKSYKDSATNDNVQVREMAVSNSLSAQSCARPLGTACTNQRQLPHW
jgi:hypothetical protein